ncbi:MAG TPA: Gfo/Idh/MocA family oxidoreductase [Candidatus Babeliales bacterium]|nr:Gfo/Idh/MocA family oxidoreductase [Candidatus Babeliales bacterium]
MIKNVAISGSGLQAETYIHYFKKKKYNIKGVKGSASERLQYLNKTYGVMIYDTVDEMVKNEEVDLLVIASRPSSHRDDVSAAIIGGIKYLIIEKPLAITIDQAVQIKKLIEDNNVNSSVAYPFRFQKTYMLIKEAIESKRFGDLKYIYGNISFPRQINISMPPFNWWIDKKISGGGSIFQVGIHWINFIFGLAGYDYELYKGSLWENEYKIDDTLSGIWKSKCGDKYIELFMTSCLPTEFLSVSFCFEEEEILYNNSSLHIISKNTKLKCLKNPIYLLERLIGRRNHITQIKIPVRDKPLMDSYLDITLNELTKKNYREFLDESVNDIKIIHSLAGLSRSCVFPNDRYQL